MHSAHHQDEKIKQIEKLNNDFAKEGSDINEKSFSGTNERSAHFI